MKNQIFEETLSIATQHALNTLKKLRNNEISTSQAIAEARNLDSISRAIRTEMVFMKESGTVVSKKTLPYVI